ncbi:MAG: TonB-dependent receptor [Bacteroidales bacterium]|nr:TonB-dependent receptor [Bacteroidales bacterium]
MRKKLFLILAMLLSAIISFAQNVGISGTVVDSNGEPLIGVSVIVKGTTTGTMTDLDGKFSLNVPSDAVLEISSIGYVTQSMPVGSTRVFNVTLADDNEMLDATVVIGYGTVKRENFTGSVATYNVGSSPVSNMTKTNAMDMLRGMTTGVTISQSGVAGSNPSLQVRGQKSISGGSAPLIILDGVIFKGNLNDIDPDTIESMSVMKDATSLAAYGSQAANGAIMITSKKGQVGKPVISFKGSVALVQQNYTPDLRDGYEYIELYNARNQFEPDNIGWLGPVEKAQYDKGEWTDWIDYVTRLGVQQDYSLNVSGATENMNYLFGASFNDNKNFIKGNEFVRETFTGRVSTNITKNISLGLNFNYSETQNDGVRPNYTAVRITPWGSPTLSDGVTMRKYVDGKEADPQNPLWNVYNGVDQTNRTNNVTLGGNLDIKIPWVKGLSYRITGNYNRRNSYQHTFTHETNFVNMSMGEAAYTTEAFDAHLSEANGSISNSQSTSYVIDNILSYTRDFGQHYISASLVYTRDGALSKSNGESGSDFSGLGNTSLGINRLADAAVHHVTAPTYSLHTDVGYLARVIYSYKNKYHFNASFRRDGSSVFGSEHKWGNFPAVGVAWTISDEGFMKSSSSWLDYLKLKASWGKNGNQSLSPYGTLSRMSMGKSGGFTYFFGDSPIFGQTLSTLGNPNLGWETTTSFNAGFEADFWGRRLHWEVDAYKSKTTDQIFNRTVPVMGAGITSQSATMGQVNNWGIESTLNIQTMRRKDFTWNTVFNFTMNRNKLVELYGDGEDDIPNNLFLGKSLGAIYGYNWIGVVQETDSEYIAANGARPGDAMYEDIDGNGQITPDDRRILGYDKEAFRLSMGNTITWKDLTLYFVFNGIFSSKMYGKASNNLAYLSYEGMQYTNMFDHPYWTKENKSQKYPAPAYNDGKFNALDSYGFVRLQDVQLSYNVKTNFLSRMGVKSLQAYVSGRNLFFIAPDWKFSDPEVRSGRSQQLARTYTLGVNIRF